MNHPLHPLLVHLPVGLWVASVIFDLVYLMNGTPEFATASYYCIGAGIVGALLAAPAGFAEYVDIPKESHPRQIARTHMVLNLVVVGLFVIDFLIRRGATDGGAPRSVTAGPFVLSVLAVALLSISGYLGGLMTFEFGIGHRPEQERKKDRQLRRVA